MKKSMPKRIVFPCLCCLSFYAGHLIVGETEALFSSGVKLEPITITSAFVFPVTVQTLEDQADGISSSMRQNFKRAMEISWNTESKQELQERLHQLAELEEQLRKQMDRLVSIAEELSEYEQQAKSIHTGNRSFAYIHEGYQNTNLLLSEVKAEIDFQRVKEADSAIRLRMKELDVEEEAAAADKPVEQDLPSDSGAALSQEKPADSEGEKEQTLEEPLPDAHAPGNQDPSEAESIEITDQELVNDEEKTLENSE
ncbi:MULTISPECIES: DUF4047 domain-containing protein [unclassified Cytobacillus]|uniref:DUF4047 domain-containing protein n=1 Tax=unclassified Cytobacillus TaxID=2675268 RepID=UPI001356F7B9|nr:DUF4047 domain-containing protein [Cytobacillus sp. AMY 15.2]KAF0819166.1 hypothetical protein KIS4809_2009 [Bacillus sp. ZZV12-4809]MCM3091828.1 DUF4047 domain-containing protein [Cytobacillus sp. AMY 15.2]